MKQFVRMRASVVCKKMFGGCLSTQDLTALSVVALSIPIVQTDGSDANHGNLNAR
jgi:hypothetical protein